ncbi:MAG: hypothetical protein IKJ57_04500, partial [Oscillospiraceae bacterium]|nr:hypothetical protein [Oscillospiraceae bacterium]
YNPGDGTIYCYGGLDTANASVGADGITAEIFLCKITGGEDTYRPVGTGEIATHKKVTTVTYVEATEGATHVYDEGTGEYVTAASGVTATHKEVTTISYRLPQEGETPDSVFAGKTQITKQKIDSYEIMPLTQNTAHALSVLVYLDGEKITNADVAATASTSMTGKMNLQFSSSATLVPMEYKDLHINGESTETEATEYTVGLAEGSLEGVTLSDNAAKATANTAYTFKLTAAEGVDVGSVSYSVGGTDKGTLTATDGVYTIPADAVTGNILIKVS